MKDAERFRLLAKYRTPRVRLGQRALCEIRGEVTVCGLTDGPIPWPPKAARPWKPAEDQLVRTLPGAEAAARAGRTLQAVRDRRRNLGLPDGRRRG
jgi:hypothetical protein